MKPPILYLLVALAVGLLVWLLSSRFPGTLDSEFALADLLYLVALLAVIGPGLWMGFKGSPGKAVRYALVWAGLLFAAFTLYAFRDVFAPIGERLMTELNPSAAIATPQGEVVIARSLNGHFWADGFINGQRVRFMVDTGASRVALSHEDAQRVGIDTGRLRYTMPVSTANGVTMTAYAIVDSVAIPPLVVKDVRVSIAQPGQLEGSLLGLSFLDGLAGYRVEGDRLILWR